MCKRRRGPKPQQEDNQQKQDQQRKHASTKKDYHTSNERVRGQAPGNWDAQVQESAWMGAATPWGTSEVDPVWDVRDGACSVVTDWRYPYASASPVYLDSHRCF